MMNYEAQFSRLNRKHIHVQVPLAAAVPWGRGILPSKRLMGMCRWMGSHFHNWTDYNGITFLARFLVELLE